MKRELIDRMIRDNLFGSIKPKCSEMDIEKYISLRNKKHAGTIKPEEEAALQQILQDAKGKIMAKELEQIEHWSKNYKNSYEPNVDAGWAKLQVRMQAAKAEDSTRLRVAARRRWLSVAAAILLIAVAGVFLLQPEDNQLVVQTEAAEQQKITLEDGSIIVLNENSKLTYPKNFNKSEQRSVILAGEAYFSVQSDATKPFVITTAQTEIAVLGTEFNVRAYPRENLTEVEVEEGRVQFSVLQSDQSVILKAGEKGIFDAGKNELSRKKPSQLNAQAWRTHRLNFVKTPLTEVFQALERYYKVKIEVTTPSIKNCEYTSDFENSQLSEVVESLSLGLGLNLKKSTPKHYIFSGEGCQ